MTKQFLFPNPIQSKYYKPTIYNSLIVLMKDQYRHLQTMLSTPIQLDQTAVQTSTYEKTQFELINQITKKTTFDCGVQTNLGGMDNPESDITGLDQLMIKKRQKRKQYKKRKKLQKKLIQKQNRQQFKQIIDLFYERQAKFLDYEDRLQQLVCSFNQSDFKNIFDSILKERVVIIQTSIWQYTQAILEENPLEMRHDHPFFLQMVDQIHKYYNIIEKSSEQAERVIYIYLSLNSKQNDEPITPQDLGRRTFRYLVETDDSLKKLLHMCDKKISLVRQVERQKLQIMISKLKNFRERSQNSLFDQDEEQSQYYENDYHTGETQSDEGSEQEQQYEDQKSTQISQNSEQFEQKPQHQTTGRKKKKRRGFINEMEQDDQRIYNFLQNLTIDKDNRLQCNVEEEFCARMLSKVQCFQKSFKKPNQFDLLMRKLDNLEPIRQVSLEYKRMY